MVNLLNGPAASLGGFLLNGSSDICPPPVSLSRHYHFSTSFNLAPCLSPQIDGSHCRRASPAATRSQPLIPRHRDELPGAPPLILKAGRPSSVGWHHRTVRSGIALATKASSFHAGHCCRPQASHPPVADLPATVLLAVVDLHHWQLYIDVTACRASTLPAYAPVPLYPTYMRRNRGCIVFIGRS